MKTPDNLPWMEINKDVDVTSVVQFKHEVRMCPYPTKAQFLFASIHPDEDNSVALRTSFEDKRDIESWLLFDGAQKAEMNPYARIDVPCPLREQDKLHTLTDFHRVDTAPSHQTRPPTTAPADGGPRFANDIELGKFRKENDEAWYWSNDSYLKTDHVNHPSRSLVDKKTKNTKDSSSTPKTKKRKRNTTPHPQKSPE